MTSLAMAALLNLSVLTAGETSYTEAHRQMIATGRPLVVLVGADWCPACQTMKQSVIPQAQKQGLLSQVSFAIVNTDQEPTLSRQLMRGGAIPQLIVYTQTAGGWQRKELIGAQSLGAIQAVVGQAVQQAKASPVQKPAAKTVAAEQSAGE